MSLVSVLRIIGNNGAEKGDFKHITNKTLADLMESDRVKEDARNLDLNDTDTIKIIQRRFLE
eukprot:5894446-Karenia_brevis.AAC.1